MFTITDNETADAVIQAHERGVRVRIISDDDKVSFPLPLRLLFLQLKGILEKYCGLTHMRLFLLLGFLVIFLFSLV